ncbi:MAG: S8 family serine peptidase [bacterium]
MAKAYRGKIYWLAGLGMLVAAVNLGTSLAAGPVVKSTTTGTSQTATVQVRSLPTPAGSLPQIEPPDRRDIARTASGRLPEPTTLKQHRAERRTYRSLADKSDLPELQVIQPDGGWSRDAARPVPVPDAGTLARLRRQVDLFGLRSESEKTEADDPTPTPRTVSPGKDDPWTTDHLLADATRMNDEYVSLQVARGSGYLYAVFDAYDLGGSDRDIHIARSTDGGESWQVWELPSTGFDEYQPELAIDGGDYLHVTWISGDGSIVYVHSVNPDDPVNWDYLGGLYVGETVLTPAIAVSGAGQFANVFVVAGWLTINYDLMQYEYTLVWFYSTNGGMTTTYDYFVPDGYQDLWPDVEMDGGMVFLVNGEQDYYSGEIEIFLAADAMSGGFGDIVSLTSWTSMSCGFPSLAADGSNVYCVYQQDFDDGLGNIDGDIIYCFSWDACANVYGPYELVADEWESVGPAIFTHGGTVGVVWLDAPAGVDEFVLSGCHATGDGHPDYWSYVETVSDQNHVEPTFRSAAGAVADDWFHAAWIDRRDFPAEGLNVYTSERRKLPDLLPFRPDGWDAELVVNMEPGIRENGLLAANQTAYVSFAFNNFGLAPASEDFFFELTVDGGTVAAWTLTGGLPPLNYVAVEDHTLVLSEGPHDIGFNIDYTNVVREDDEGNNSYSGDFLFYAGDPVLRVSPETIIHFLPAPGKGGDRLERLAADPPLRRQVHLPVISSRLDAALQQAAPGEKFRVVLQSAARVDGEVMNEALRGVPLPERRATVIAALRQQSGRDATTLSPLLDDLIQRGEMLPPQALWLSGQFFAEMTATAVQVLAKSADVGWLWLDDIKSEPFGSITPQSPGALTPAGDPKVPAWHIPHIGADVAWGRGYDGSGILIGHIDTGVAYDHPDLANHLWDGGPTYPHHGWDCLDEDDDPYDDPYYHGTFTAGLIVGDGTQGTETGAAPGAELMVVRSVPGYFLDTAEGLQFCLDNGAVMISYSAGWSDPAAGTRESNRYNAEQLGAAGIPWICAAGNGDGAGGHYPVPTDIASPGDSPHPWYGSGGHSAVIAVGASDDTDRIYSWSSVGPTSWDITGTYTYVDYPYPPGLIKPDLAAPGEDVTSTFENSGYGVGSGSSMAAPLVTAACAILVQANPSLTLLDLAELLETTAVDIESAGRDNLSGAGRVDIVAALDGMTVGEIEHFWVHNDGPLSLHLTQVNWSAGWLDISPTTTTVAPLDSVRFTATFDGTGYGTGTYTEQVTLVSDDPDSPHDLAVKMVVGDMTGVGDGETVAAPARSNLGNYPNPFNPRTVLRFENRVAGQIRLGIYDLQGRLVRLLLETSLPAGNHERIWDGLDQAGQPLSSGIYLARFTGEGGQRAVHKVTLVR